MNLKLTYIAVSMLCMPFVALANTSDILSVSSNGIEGVVGDVVPITFTITSKNLDCSNYKIHLQGNDMAHTHLLFTGAGSPSLALREDNSVYWSGKEIHTGDSLKFTAYAKIIQNTLGKTIKGFRVLSGCGIYDHYSVVDGTPTIDVVEKTKSLSAANVKSTDVHKLFAQVYGRKPTSKELGHWNKRVHEKKTSTALKGAMVFHKIKGSTGVGVFKK